MPCEASGDETDMSDSDPCLRALDGFLEVLGKTPASPEPCEGALHDPASGEDLEALGAVRAFDDFHGPAPDLVQGAGEFGSGIATVGEGAATGSYGGWS